MNPPPDVDYTVVLLFPGFGEAREYAEEIVQTALDWLNTNKDEPGMRFAYQVSAHLEILQDADDVLEKIAADDSVALVIACGLEGDEWRNLLHECADRDVARCQVVEGPPPRPSVGAEKGEWKIVFRKRSTEELSAHRITEDTLTAPLDDEEILGERVGQLITVMALGVMEHHWLKNPPRHRLP